MPSSIRAARRLQRAQHHRRKTAVWIIVSMGSDTAQPEVPLPEEPIKRGSALPRRPRPPRDTEVEVVRPPVREEPRVAARAPVRPTTRTPARTAEAPPVVQVERIGQRPLGTRPPRDGGGYREGPRSGPGYRGPRDGERPWVDRPPREPQTRTYDLRRDETPDAGGEDEAEVRPWSRWGGPPRR